MLMYIWKGKSRKMISVLFCSSTFVHRIALGLFASALGCFDSGRYSEAPFAVILYGRVFGTTLFKVHYLV